MPESTSTTSEQGEDDSESHFVLDFLYHDSRRIGSFLSQFEGDGHLQQLTRTKDGKRGRTSASTRDVKGDAGIVKGSLAGKTETSLLMSEGYSRVFDPYWANARAFLSYLSENDLLKDELVGSQIGQFIRVSGYLSVLDLSMLKEMWTKPAIQKRVLSGNDSRPLSSMTAAQKAAAREQKEENELTLELMQTLPHSVHASMITADEEPSLVWGTLRDEYLTTPASDITLAHGGRMPGVWSIVGILTAFPEWQVPDLSGEVDGDNVGMLESLIGQLSKKLAPIARVALGRPAGAYAITPLLIFREVA